MLAPAGEPATDPILRLGRSLASLLQLPQPDSVDGSQVGARHGRLCPVLAESAGQLPGHRHCRGRGGHSIPATTSAHPSVHPARPPASRGCLAVEGGYGAGHQRDIPRVLQPIVPGPKEDRTSAACDRSLHSQPPHGSSTLQDGDARVRLLSHQKSGVDSIDRHPRCLPSCSNAPGRPQVSTLHGQQASLPIHLPSFRFSNIPRAFTKLLRPVVALLRQQGVKLRVYLDDWLIRADTPEQAKLHAQTTISVLQFLGWIVNYEMSDLTPSQDFQFIGMQFNKRQFTVAPLPKMRLKVQAVHQHQHWMTNPNITARDLHRLLSMLVFMASLVQQGGKTPSSSGPVVGRHNMVPEDRELVQPDTPRRQGDGSDSLYGCVQFGLWSASQRSWHINALMQAVINAVRDFLPHLRSGVVRLMCDNAVTVA